MKKYILILIPFIFWGCQKDFNTVIDTQSVNSQVIKVTMADSISYKQTDSLIVVSIQLNSSSGIKSVSANIIASDLTQLNDSPLILYDNGDIPDNGDTTKGDNIFSNKFPLSRYYPNGTYTVLYFITDNSNNTQMAAVHSFIYNNLQTAIAPVISNLNMPDTVSIGASFTFSVKVTDGNGLSDIDSVYYILYKPDGTLIVNAQGISKFPLSDNGDTGVSGDVTAGDGIYTMKLTFPSGQPTGSWKFELIAVNREGLTSNIITHKVVVQ
jgi:hypothetical protein